MTINNYRLPGEAPAQPDDTKENAPAENQGAGNKQNETGLNHNVEHSRETERERGLFLPLAWAQLGREAKAKPFKGKAKRQARADAIRVKRMGGAIAAELAALLVLAVVAGVLLVGVLR